MEKLILLLVGVLFVSCCVAFDANDNSIESIIGSSISTKGKSKTIKFLEGRYTSKIDLPSKREEYWMRMRIDDQAGNVVPMERYISAKSYIQENLSPNNKRDIVPTHVWTNLGPSQNKIDGGRTRSILVQNTTPATLYAGAVAGGVWKSIDGGANWVPLTDLIANIAISTLAQDPNTNPSNIIYAGTGEGFFSGDARRGAGVFKTIDAGSTWTHLLETNNSNFYYVNKLVVSGTDVNRIYAATRAGLFVSNDAGQTWGSLRSTTTARGFFDLAVFVNNALDVIYGWEGEKGLWVSQDSGTSWNLVLTGTSATYYRGSIAVAPSSNNIAYISMSDRSGFIQALWRTTDFGVTWTDRLAATALNNVLLSNPLYSYVNPATNKDCFGGTPGSGYPQGWYDNAIAVDPTNSDNVLVGGIDLFRSTDGAVNFVQLSNWWSSGSTYNHADQHFITFSPNFAVDQTVYFGNDGGIFKTSGIYGIGQTSPCGTGSQVAFAPLNNGYATLQFYHGTVSRVGNIYVAGAQDNGSWKSSNNLWSVVGGGDGGYTAIDYNSLTRFYTTYVQMSIFRHDTGTDSTVTILDGSPDSVSGNGLFINPFIMDPNNPKILYTCNNELWKTSDATAATVVWTSLGSIGSALDPDGLVSALAITPQSTVLYLGDEAGRFFKVNLVAPVSIVQVGSSTLNPSSGFVIGGITVDPIALGTVYVMISTFGDHHLWKSTDFGSTFSPLGTGLPDVPTWALFVVPAQPTIMYLGTDLGVLFSSDSGNTWTSVDQYGLANTPIVNFDYQASSDTLFAFTHGRGVYGVNLQGKALTSTTGETSSLSMNSSSSIVILIGLTVALIAFIF